MVDLMFDVPRVALTIYNGTSSTATLKDYSLSSFTMNKFICEFDMLHDGHFNANVKIKSFVVKDTRVNTDSKFPVIIPSVDGVDNQFTLLVTTEGPAESRNTTAMLTVETPNNISTRLLVRSTTVYKQGN